MLHKLLNIKLSISVIALLVMLSTAFAEIKQKETEIASVESQLATYKTIGDKALGLDLANLSSVKVTVSSYNPVKSQTDSTPLHGSDGSLVAPGIVAISSDLRNKYGINIGDKVILENYGAFVVKDRMASRWKKRVDIISFSKKWSKEFGIKEGVNLYYNKES